jgi:hypothetical protein
MATLPVRLMQRPPLPSGPDDAPDPAWADGGTIDNAPSWALAPLLLAWPEPGMAFTAAASDPTARPVAQAGSAIAAQAPNPAADSAAIALAVPQAQAAYLAATGVTLDGAGLKIGILSDSFNLHGGEASAIAEGYLPPASQIDIIKEGSSGNDEGQAMAELIHQIAPAATIYFYTATDSEADFAAGISTLVADGVNVLVDDINYSDEPFFQNTGVITQAVEAAVAGGVDYFTAAGNAGENYYQAVFNKQPIMLPGIPQALMVNAVSGTSPYETVIMAADPVLDFSLQWNEPFGASRYNLGVALYADVGGTYTLIEAFGHPAVTSDPVLAVDGSIDLAAGTYDLAFYEIASDQVNGAAVTPGTFKLIFFDDSGATLTGVGAGVGGGASFGHELAPGANTVGAIDVDETPSQGVATPVAEPYSSAGPGVITLNAQGQTLAQAQTVGTPDFAATDGTPTTVFNPFFGTSAAAPNAAAVSLLMLQADPRLTTVQVTYMLERSAIPTADTLTAGAGLIQADTAVAEALSADTTPLWTDQDSTDVWSDALNWSDGAVPGAASPVSITDGAGIFTDQYAVFDDDPSDSVAALSVDGGGITGAYPFLYVDQGVRLDTGTLTLGLGVIALRGTLIDAGGLATGSAVGTVDVQGGVLSIGAQTGATGISFDDMPGGDLVLAAGPAAPDTDRAAVIGDFVAGDTIDLPNLPGTLVAGVQIDGAAVTLVDQVGNTLAALTFSGTIPGLRATTDAAGGTEIMACYAAGTRIATVAGPVPIERLRVGDRLLTPDGSPGAVIWIGHRRLDCRLHPDPELVWPVCIAAGALAPGLPARDLLVSPDHGMWVDGALIPARLLVNHRSISRASTIGVVTYFHVELARHALILAEGVPAESYLDTGNRAIFDNAPLTALHPDLSAVQPRHGMALTTAAAEVFPVWRRLARRAGLAGDGAAAPAGADVPAGLALVAGSRRLRPVWAAGSDAAFALPRHARQARLVCPAERPSRHAPWLDDRRLLGVAVSDLWVDGARLALDDPGLDTGWWPMEHAARAFRWTNGDAWLRLPDNAAVLTLRLHAAMQTTGVQGPFTPAAVSCRNPLASCGTRGP